MPSLWLKEALSMAWQRRREAMGKVINESNLMQRSFDDLTTSEKSGCIEVQI